MKKKLLFFYLATVIPSVVVSQQPSRTVAGTVTGPEGLVAGVSVTAKVAGSQVATSFSGTYSIIADPQDTLVFNSIGYETQAVPVAGRTTVDVSLTPSTSSLDEVVVVGYGTQTRRNVTGAVAKVDMKQTENLPNTNVSQALRGRVAGVQFIDNGRPGQGGSILIRGQRSLSGGNNPLIIVDGIQFNGSINYLSPSDIQSMEILKDASAAAIYGSRAANGVILVTTKKGTSDKPSITLNANYGLSEWSKRVRLLSPERYLEKTLQMRKILGLDADPSKIREYLAPSEQLNYDAGKTTDPWDAISQQGKLANYDVSISGRTSNSNYYTSASIADDHGLIYGDFHKRHSVRVNIETQLTKWLQTGINASYLRRDLSGVNASIGQAAVASPYGTYYYEDGEPTLNTVEGESNSGNPMRSALLTRNEEIYNNLFSNFYFRIAVPFIKGLEYRLNYSPNYRWDHNYNFFRQDKHISQNTTTANKFFRQDFDWVYENILTYTRKIGERHSLDATLMYGRNHRGVEDTRANANQLSMDALGWNSLELGSLLTNTSSASQEDGVSSMFRLNYGFKDRYFATFTMRRDGSSVFSESHKYAIFPSFSAAWVVSDENFLADHDFVDFIKYRMSYGSVGNQAISRYQSLSLTSTSRYVFGDASPSFVGIFPSSMGNSELKWETTYTLNAALDFELFSQRLSGTIEWYKMNTHDLLVQRSLPTMSGFNSIWTNLGEIQNQGVELSLNTENIRTDAFSWSTNITFSKNSNKIISLYGSDTDNDGKEDDDLGNRWFIGHPIDVFYDFVSDGIYQTDDNIPANYKPGDRRFQDLNDDNKLDASNDRMVVGVGQPKYRLGLGNNISYKNFTFSIFLNSMLEWVGEFRKADPNSNFGGNYPARQLNQFDNGWWTAENKSNTAPSLGYNNPLQSSFYFNRDFIRIQDISLAYSLPENLLSRIHLKGLTLSASAKNLKTFTKWPGSDPESGEAIGFPMPRTISLGCNIVL
ncbi:SusC/RagA family TonB-linked outer membrane protein [Parapedobacter pyrenivorans]|uniref:SusC/RagA family TonB-linked outer membrane protein n=1 Tax=Parapedobacter pyrenivorans TaxID=1305674 RepID=A0A917MAR1_9SPHI|nr:TonB-dependent receptor [Parapedobacter pyrenivorans]GGG89780.1 SusC/RagA family TonB-linked outer membrane protein [Parapedobacter pyrenivorans]